MLHAHLVRPVLIGSELFSPRYVRSMFYLITMYGLWNLWAGYNGFFTPYLIEQNHLPQWAATVLPASYFGIGIVSILAIFMTLADKVNQRTMFGISALLHVGGMALLAVFGFTLNVVIVHIVIMGVAAGFGAQSFFQLWSAEMFPTSIRSTAQGLTFAVVRVGAGHMESCGSRTGGERFQNSGLDSDCFSRWVRLRRLCLGSTQRRKIARVYSGGTVCLRRSMGLTSRNRT